MEESVIGLILRTDVSPHLTLSQCGLGVQDDHTRHRVRAIHQRGRTFQYLDASDAAAIDLYAVLVAPLLTFLTYTFAHDYYAVIAQSADDGFRNTTASGELAHAWLMGDGINDIGRGRSP